MRQHFMQRIFAIDLKRWRQKYGFTQLDVAIAVRCSPAHISRLEKGLLEDHMLETILLICDIMGEDIHKYFTEKVG